MMKDMSEDSGKILIKKLLPKVERHFEYLNIDRMKKLDVLLFSY